MPSVRVVEPSGPAVVLGSTQSAGVVDAERAAAAGVAVVGRRSGGGAVLVRPGELVWADVFVPAGDRLWAADVGRATHWLGELWAEALADLGVEVTWHDGPLVAARWSTLVCFAGLGPGEVRQGSAKVVGTSQRRTRAGALFQCAALLRWDPAALLGLLDLSAREREAGERVLSGVAAGLAVAARDLEARLLAGLALR